MSEKACDRCGPAARASWVVKAAAGLLFFCGHCFAKHAAAFKERGYRTMSLKERSQNGS